MSRTSSSYRDSSNRRRRIILQLHLSSSDPIEQIVEAVAETPKPVEIPVIIPVIEESPVLIVKQEESIQEELPAPPDHQPSVVEVVLEDDAPIEAEMEEEVIQKVVQEELPVATTPAAPAPKSTQKSPIFTKRRRALPVPSTVPGLVRMLETTPQLHWFFTGDDLSLSGQTTDSGSIALAHVQYLKEVVGRTEDTFEVQTSPHFRLQDLQRNFEKMVAADSPQVVVILCGQTELQTRWENTLAFERMFHKLILKIRNAGAVPIIATPPWPCPTESFYHSDELIRLEAIRACAEESAALLVDHWEHWEHSSTADWYSGNGHTLSKSGIMAMVNEFSRTLNLAPQMARN